MGQSAAQKAVAKKFKLAIAYRKAHPNLSQKQAFAKVFGKRVLNEPVKKKKSLASRMNTKSKIKPIKKIGRPVSDNSRGAGHTSTKTKADTRNNRTATTTKTITAHVKVGTIGQVMSAGKTILSKKLGDLEAKKFMAKKKSDKNRFAREIRDVKSQLRKFL